MRARCLLGRLPAFAALIEEIRGSPLVTLDGVEIEVEDGVVTLAGRPPGHAHVRLLPREAHQAGTRRVRSLLRIGGQPLPRSPDTSDAS